jgi:hypothetical protein
MKKININNKSAQEIEDYYVDRGLKNDELRRALMSDSEYRQVINNKRRQRINIFGLTSSEKLRYVLATDLDVDILKRTKSLLGCELSEEDRETLEFILTQLYEDWRSPIFDKLNAIERKYR